VTDWPRAIKEIAEGPWGKKILFLLTGSSTIDLKFSSERLPGRRGKIQNLDFEFLPLSFKEFIQTVKPSLLEKDPKKALYKKLHYRHLFREYLLCGGFPAVINSYYKNNLIETFTYKLYTAWISGDLHKMGKSDTLADQMLAKLILSLSTPISIYEITKESGLASHGTTAEYLELFEELYCLARLNCYLIPQKRFDPKKNHKFYFLDPFILNSLHAKIKESLDEGFSLSKRFINNPVIYPHLVESVVAAHLKRKTATQLFYGRLDKEKEVDFVRVSKLGEEFFEVKYQKTIKTSEFYPIAKAIGNKKLTIITRDTFAKEKNIQMLPLEVFLATLD
jgi:predicted AAA+ superfamily ATPase